MKQFSFCEEQVRHNKLRLYLHVVWATWDRLPLIDSEVERDLYRCLTSICLEIHCSLRAVGGMPDHVHVLLAYPATRAVAEIVKALKGSSSRYVNGRSGSDGFFKWQGRYGAFTVSAHEAKKVQRYIQNQKAHHATGHLWPSAEETYEEDPPAE